MWNGQVHSELKPLQERKRVAKTSIYSVLSLINVCFRIIRNGKVALLSYMRERATKTITERQLLGATHRTRK